MAPSRTDLNYFKHLKCSTLTIFLGQIDRILNIIEYMPACDMKAERIIELYDYLIANLELIYAQPKPNTAFFRKLIKKLDTLEPDIPQLAFHRERINRYKDIQRARRIRRMIS